MLNFNREENFLVSIAFLLVIEGNFHAKALSLQAFLLSIGNQLLKFSKKMKRTMNNFVPLKTKLC